MTFNPDDDASLLAAYNLPLLVKRRAQGLHSEASIIGEGPSMPAACRAAVLADGMSSFGIYLIGFVILILGLAYGAFLAGLAPQWILVGTICALGIGVVGGVVTMRQKDPGSP